jgi:chromosomal replication initiator protein
MPLSTPVEHAVDEDARRVTEVQVSDHEQVWTATAQLLRAQVSEAVWLSTFQDAAALPGEGSPLTLTVSSSHVRDKILNRYLAIIRDALEEIGAADIELIVDVSPQPDLDADNQGSTSRYSAPPERIGPAQRIENTPAYSELNARYTFETFVKGASNQFALAAALRVAETPARSYNPLFIYGSAGLGKTHLLHAISHYVNQNYAHYHVRYVSTETFLNEFVDAIRTNTTTNFKRRYRDVDVLLIDDIQFMEGKEGLQEEFFHTFNSLHGANKQIIISSDRMPDNIPTLEERLRGRFKWGLITDIQPPDLETRLAILRNKSERDQVHISPDVLEFIATHITNNIRELEGALIRVGAYATLNRVPISVSLAQQLLADLLSNAQPKVRSGPELLSELSDYLGHPVDALKGKSRQRPLVTARQIAMYVFRDQTDMSYPAIAREFGGRDHTTVIHAVDKVQRLMKERKAIYDQVTDLIQRLKQV